MGFEGQSLCQRFYQFRQKTEVSKKLNVVDFQSNFYVVW